MTRRRASVPSPGRGDRTLAQTPVEGERWGNLAKGNSQTIRRADTAGAGRARPEAAHSAHGSDRELVVGRTLSGPEGAPEDLARRTALQAKALPKWPRQSGESAQAFPVLRFFLCAPARRRSKGKRSVCKVAFVPPASSCLNLVMVGEVCGPLAAPLPAAAAPCRRGQNPFMMHRVWRRRGRGSGMPPQGSEKRAETFLAVHNVLDPDAVIAFDDDHLAAGDHTVVHDHLHGLDNAAVELHDAAAGELNGVLEF